jgi:hypothetical protein
MVESTRHSKAPQTELELLAARIDATFHGIAAEPRWRKCILPHLEAAFGPLPVLRFREG